MIFMVTMPKKQADDSKKKRVSRKPRKTAVSSSSRTKKKKPTVTRSIRKKPTEKSVVKKSSPKKAAVPTAKAQKPVTSISVPKRKRVLRRPAMAEMQQRASEIVPELPSVRRRNDRRGAMRALMSHGMVLGAFVSAVVVGAFVIRVTNAAEFQGPPVDAPGGNIPVTIWNAEATGSLQENASIDIDGPIVTSGPLTVGATPLDLGSGAAGQNAFYGVTSYPGMHSGDKLLLLQTESSGTYTDRFSVDKEGSVFLRGELQKTAGSQVMNSTSMSGNFRMTQQDGGGRFHMGWNINGNMLASGTYRISGEPSLWERWNTNGFTWFVAPAGTAGNAIVWTSAIHASVNGRVGIGMIGPGYPLDVRGVSTDTSAIVRLSHPGTLVAGTAVYTGMALSRNWTEQWFLGMNDADDDLRFRSGAADVVTVTQSGDVNAAGSITAEGCFGASFVGVTTTGGTGAPAGSGSYKAGDILSYYGINNKCDNDYSGSHACTVNEMLESLRCSVPTSPIRSHGGMIAWINGGPPGFTANSNDCIGWTNTTSSAYGRYWSFDNITGGFGTMTTCNAPGLKIACCL